MKDVDLVSILVTLVVEISLDKVEKFGVEKSYF